VPFSLLAPARVSIPVNGEWDTSFVVRRLGRAFCCRFCDQRSSSKGSIGFLVASTIYACLKLLLGALFTIQMYILVSNRGLRDGWSWYFSFYLFIWSLYFAFLVTPAR
jgi:hypothetical protein